MTPRPFRTTGEPPASLSAVFPHKPPANHPRRRKPGGGGGFNMTAQLIQAAVTGGIPPNLG